ncbi:hypothetical protein Barb7_00895 [Bacteroidales bacterium Barb7]|nr:hypothetical protein Barb7_00895 [Bacteroidales bacterium Barb7]
MKEIKPVKSNTLHYYMAGLTILFAVTFSYTFNSKIDINGDNCAYYMLATSKLAVTDIPILQVRLITPPMYSRPAIRY